MKKDRKYVNDLEGRIAALEVLVISLVKMQIADEFKPVYFDEKEAAITGLLGNSTVSDEMHDVLEDRLREFEAMLRISSTTNG